MVLHAACIWSITILNLISIYIKSKTIIVEDLLYLLFKRSTNISLNPSRGDFGTSS